MFFVKIEFPDKIGHFEIKKLEGLFGNKIVIHFILDGFHFFKPGLEQNVIGFLLSASIFDLRINFGTKFVKIVVDVFGTILEQLGRTDLRKHIVDL
jgi:hypothetical protein